MPRRETEGPVAQAMREKLEAAFAPTTLTLADDSYKHAGHMGYKGDDAETHFTLTIAAKAFAGMGRVDRQRAIYKVLAEEMAGPVHALAIRASADEG